MFGKFVTITLSAILTSVLMLSLLACAQPRYVKADDIGSSGGGEQTHGDGKADLTLAFKNQPLYVSWSWEKKPTTTETGTLIFKTYRPNEFDQSAVPMDIAADVNVLLWMPAMGHGSSPTTVERLDVGTYSASQVFFIMPGEWEIHFQSKSGNDLKDEAVVSLTF